MSESGVAVEARGISKNYPLSDSQFARFRHVVAGGKKAFRGGLWALRDATFTVHRGEAFGIIGANGSGKSTLLQIVSGILRPTSGTVQVNGRLSALLELGSGFSPEFTGRDNIYLNGSLLGLTREEIDAKFEQIIRFAEIGDFLEQPIRTYSTGMVLRLAFAVASHVDPEVLIVDEALAVGDIAFRQRCMRRIHDLRANGTTILFVSHETSDVKALCERCLWLQNGVVQEVGEADDVVARYLAATLHRENLRIEAEGHRQELLTEDAPAADLVKGFAQTTPARRYGDGRATIVGAETRNAAGARAIVMRPLENFVLRISFRSQARIDSPIAGFLVRNSRGEDLFGSNTARENYPLRSVDAGDTGTVEFHWAAPRLAPGVYRISLAISDGTVEDFQVCDYLEDALEISVPALTGSSQPPHGYFQLNCAAVTVHQG